MRKLKVAVTGNIGSGKSSFCKFLEQYKFIVIKADDISKKLLTSDPHVKKEIIKYFGPEAYLGDKVNTQYLSDRVFSNTSELNKINSILHPLVIKKTEYLMGEALRSSNIVFVEAALIYEANMEKLFDYVVLISSQKEIRFKRKQKSDNFSSEEFEKREINQIKEDEKQKQADFIFTNNGTIPELETKAKVLINVLNGLLLS